MAVNLRCIKTPKSGCKLLGSLLPVCRLINWSEGKSSFKSLKFRSNLSALLRVVNGSESKKLKLALSGSLLTAPPDFSQKYNIFHLSLIESPLVTEVTCWKTHNLTLYNHKCTLLYKCTWLTMMINNVTVSQWERSQCYMFSSRYKFNNKTSFSRRQHVLTSLPN